jgi:hypothetical protein
MKAKHWFILLLAVAAFIAFNDESPRLNDIESQMAREVF